MTVSAFYDSDSNSYQIYGIARGSDAGAPLGRRYFQKGAHWIGFDDNFAEPVVVRSYFDPTQDPTAMSLARKDPPLAYIGYMQFMRMSFNGLTIPPEVYGGVLAQRQPYVYGAGQEMVDFMDPYQAKASRIKEPLYPYNAILVSGVIKDESSFFYQPLPNGSLCANDNLGATQSLVASLAAEITASLLDEETVENVVNDDNLLVTITPTSEQLAKYEAYQIAFDWLTTNPLPDSMEDTPFLDGVDKSQVAAQVVGDYVLMTMPDPEDLGDTLIVSTAASSSGTQVVVHLLSEYEYVAMSTDAAREALWRIREYQLDQGTILRDEKVGTPPTGRGLSGLTTPPYTLSASTFSLELKYWTAAIGVRARDTRSSPRLTMLSCLEWAALFQFDEDTGLMTLAAIREPKLNDSFNPGPGYAQFVKARDEASDEDTLISTSNFTKAAMARDNFAAGNKLSFVNAACIEI